MLVATGFLWLAQGPPAAARAAGVVRRNGEHDIGGLAPSGPAAAGTWAIVSAKRPASSGVLHSFWGARVEKQLGAKDAKLFAL